jgi:hypothetical protein
MANIYSQPEAFGLTPIGEADAGSGYDYDIWVVWRDAGGACWWAQDKGCSCPVPFAGAHLGNIPRGSLRDALNDLFAWVTEYDYGNDAVRRAAAQPRVERLRKMIDHEEGRH